MMLRFLRAIVTLVVTFFATAVAFYVFGAYAGWLNVHDPRGPDWWRLTYLILAMGATPIVAVIASVRSWQKGPR